MNTNDWNQYNPPPQGAVIPSTIRIIDASINTGSFVSSWPVNKYLGTITETTTLDYAADPFNFIKINPSGLNITLNIDRVPIGTMIMVQVDTGTVKIVANETIVTASSLNVGTYVVIIFSDSVRYNDLKNPTAV
jgi:hypothetical protein